MIFVQWNQKYMHTKLNPSKKKTEKFANETVSNITFDNSSNFSFFRPVEGA